MLLSAFAYAHFVNLADPETRKKLSDETVQAPVVLGRFEYKAADFFGGSNAMLTDFARKEIAEILTVQQKQLLIISVPATSEARDGQRLRQWEKVAARSAAIADAFQKAGQDSNKIVLKVPDKLVSKANGKQNIMLTFQPSGNAASDK
tara:strand:+ start:5717 stop:6160 length:444 start_codon:yes stop_codon:yes gene_type:complete